MNTPNQDFRNQFLAQACRYLFGPAANCEALQKLGLAMPALRPIPVASREHLR